VSCAKTAEPIEMPFAWVTGVGVLDEGIDPKAICGGCLVNRKALGVSGG